PLNAVHGSSKDRPRPMSAPIGRFVRSALQRGIFPCRCATFAWQLRLWQACLAAPAAACATKTGVRPARPRLASRRRHASSKAVLPESKLTVSRALQVAATADKSSRLPFFFSGARPGVKRLQLPGIVALSKPQSHQSEFQETLRTRVPKRRLDCLHVC